MAEKLAYSLCGIYIRVILSLLKRYDVEQWRLVSRLSNWKARNAIKGG